MINYYYLINKNRFSLLKTEIANNIYNKNPQRTESVTHETYERTN